ncbi:STAS domain-containing protein [Fictibacillus iocasae]|uniref:STAS domain-containing protein n=1 Tax=Fictibacillus iocasae TaxID=2715437 RepID=A0ABW2NMS1_9BACL
MKTQDTLGNLLIQNKRHLAHRIDELRMNNGETHHQVTEEVIALRSELFHFFGEALHSDESSSSDKFKEWGIKSGELAVKYDLPLDQALESTRYYRVVLWEFIKKQAENLRLDAAGVIKLASIIDPLLDQTVHSFSVAYVEYNNHILSLAREAIEELSVPVVRLTSSLAILPLVGTIDTYRSKLIMDTALQKCMEYQVERLFIDLSGVPVIDTMVAHNLFQVINSLKLLGVEVTLSGMRPELSQTVVSLGISFDGLSIVGSLYQELEKFGISQ